MNEIIVFRNLKSVLVGRYVPGIILSLGFIFLPLSDGNLIKFWRSTFEDLFSLFMVFSIVSIAEMTGIINTSQHIKSLKIKNDVLFIKLFGVFREKSLQLNYSDILSIEWSQNGLKHFVLNLKNGEQKLIRSEIYDREKAFDLIQQNIKKSKTT
jgi:hypothetical protein